MPIGIICIVQCSLFCNRDIALIIACINTCLAIFNVHEQAGAQCWKSVLVRRIWELVCHILMPILVNYVCTHHLVPTRPFTIKPQNGCNALQVVRTSTRRRKILSGQMPRAGRDPRTGQTGNYAPRAGTKCDQCRPMYMDQGRIPAPERNGKEAAESVTSTRRCGECGNKSVDEFDCVECKSTDACFVKWQTPLQFIPHIMIPRLLGLVCALVTDNI